MSKSVIDDHFNSGGQVKGKKRTTRFYGVKFIKSKASDRGQYFSSADTVANDILSPHEYFREVYGPILCSLLVTSALAIILGSGLALAGYYVPQINEQKLLSHNMLDIEAIKKAESYNNNLHSLRIAGIVLLAIGGVAMAVLLLIPFICLQRSEYSLLPTEDDTTTLLSAPTPKPIVPKTPDADYSFSVVKQHIQPRKQPLKSSKRLHHHRSDYDKGFLSPELHRGPIFVSDDSCKIGDQRRNRSSSFDSRLSPRHTRRIRHEDECRRHEDESRKSLSPDHKRTLSKAGSFHSLK